MKSTDDDEDMCRQRWKQFLILGNEAYVKMRAKYYYHVNEKCYTNRLINWWTTNEDNKCEDRSRIVYFFNAHVSS